MNQTASIYIKSLSIAEDQFNLDISFLPGSFFTKIEVKISYNQDGEKPMFHYMRRVPNSHVTLSATEEEFKCFYFSRHFNVDLGISKETGKKELAFSLLRRRENTEFIISLCEEEGKFQGEVHIDGVIQNHEQAQVDFKLANL